MSELIEKVNADVGHQVEISVAPVMATPAVFWAGAVVGAKVAGAVVGAAAAGAGLKAAIK